MLGGRRFGARCESIIEGEVSRAFNPGGGLHHSDRDRAAGFCVFNDVAVAVRYLQRKYGVKRIAVVDVDGHHGDGTQRIFYRESILTISSHRIGIYPGTGYVDEVGEAGAGVSRWTYPCLPEPTRGFPLRFRRGVLPLIEAYEPEILVNQFGVDGHYQDPLVGLGLTTKTYLEVSFEVARVCPRALQG